MASALQAFLHWPVLGPKGHRGLLFVVGYIFAFTLEISETQSLGMVLHARPSCFPPLAWYTGETRACHMRCIFMQ